MSPLGLSLALQAFALDLPIVQLDVTVFDLAHGRLHSFGEGTLSGRAGRLEVLVGPCGHLVVLQPLILLIFLLLPLLHILEGAFEELLVHLFEGLKVDELVLGRYLHLVGALHPLLPELLLIVPPRIVERSLMRSNGVFGLEGVHFFFLGGFCSPTKSSLAIISSLLALVTGSGACRPTSLLWSSLVTERRALS